MAASDYVVAFAGRTAAVRCSQPEPAALLDFLFADLRGEVGSTPAVLDISPHSSGQYLLADSNRPLFCGRLGVQFAAALFDQIIFQLLNTTANGVALHAGAVSWQGKTILLPGRSGSGKSSVTALLAAAGFSYQSDELVFLPDDGSGAVVPFPRPLCLKPGSAAAVRSLLAADRQAAILADEQGAVIPHRLLNPAFVPHCAPPALLLFPVYQVDAPLNAEKLSPARATALLMGCDVNARNLPDHGFRQLASLARSVPAWQLTYSRFASTASALANEPLLRLLEDILHGA